MRNIGSIECLSVRHWGHMSSSHTLALKRLTFGSICACRNTSLMSLYCNVQNDYFKKRERRRERKIINRINAIVGIMLLFIGNDGHVTNHVTTF